MRASIGAAALALLAFLVVGCGPARTRADVVLEITDVSEADSKVLVHASGPVCDDKLDIRLERDGPIIVASGRGLVPDNEFGYCDKYIDTGGEGTSRHDVSATLRLDPGTYTVRNVDGSSVIEFSLDSDGVTSSAPHSSLAEAADVEARRIVLEPQREATVALATRVDELFERDGTRREEVSCSYAADIGFLNEPPNDSNLTVCNVDATFATPAGSGPLAPDELQRMGCVDNSIEVDLSYQEWDVACSLQQPDFAPGAGLDQLHIRGHYRNRSGSNDRLWIQYLYVWIA